MLDKYVGINIRRSAVKNNLDKIYYTVLEI